MRKLLFLFLLLISSVQGRADDDIDTLLLRLDSAVANKETYRQRHEQRIKMLKAELEQTQWPDLRVDLSLRLAHAYSAYKNDSALAYLHRSVEQAEQLGNPSLIGRCRAALVQQCANVLLASEGMTTLNKINPQVLDESGMVDYLRAAGSIYSVLASQTSNPVEREAYSQRATACIDSLLQLLPADNIYSLLHRVDRELPDGNVREARRLIDLWEKKVTPNSHDEAVMAFYRYEVYKRIGDDREAMRSIIRSALCDVENAVYDEAAIIYLSRILRDKGDTRRALTYMRYAFDVATSFGAQMKNWLMMDVQSINLQYEAQLNEINHKRLLATIGLGLLSAITICLLFFFNRQRIALKRSNQKINSINDELQKINQNLTLLNRQKDQTNEQLNESNIIKEEYIGMFFGLCVSYIEQQENYRKTVNKLVRNHQIDDIFRLTKSNEGDSETYTGLYEKFDQVFLSLFPQFVEQFNSLLQETSRIETKPYHLTTPLRIYALIRLGISDSTKISRFLNLANSTVYNYRVKYRNAALVNRNAFEEAVKQLGTIRNIDK